MFEQSPNLLLNALSPKSRTFLLSRLRPVDLAAREVLYEPDECPKFAHFMTSGIASFVGTMSSGGCAEVGIWGKEGLVECFHAATGALQRKGLIRYSRGRIHIVDPAGLKREACECYATVREINQTFSNVAVVS